MCYARGAKCLGAFVPRPANGTRVLSVYRCVVEGVKPKTTARERCDGARVRRNPSYPPPSGALLGRPDPLGSCLLETSPRTPSPPTPPESGWLMRGAWCAVDLRHAHTTRLPHTPDSGGGGGGPADWFKGDRSPTGLAVPVYGSTVDRKCVV